MNEIPKQYNPRDTEDKWYRFWEEKQLFRAEINPAKKPFTIVIPPPNVTGILHMGHALNNTIQDILIRYHRMKGEESLWMPGTDHAGIATQNVVEKQLAKDGLKRQDLGRDKFIERVWQWKEQYGSTIIRQLKKLGASCDWQRLRFTMDEGYSQAVLEAFVRLYEKDLIYQGSYIINWCPRCQTALSDEEAPHQEREGNLYYLRYPLKDPALARKGWVVVATTRPETMLGDTAVAVNPKDKRYKDLIGKTLILPLIKREIKIIADSLVDMKFGSGAVKVTPAHDPDDYALGKKHGLEFIKVMRPDGTMNEQTGRYQGLDRFKAREQILADLRQHDLLEKSVPHQLSVGHCYRCHTVIEPYLSRQWFVKMNPLARPAVEAVKKGKIKFYPQRWTKVYLNWMENLQDWCISRQIWWGHRLPVYYCKKCAGQANERTENTEHKTEKGVIVSQSIPEKCPACGSTDIYQDEDVLDTWFSSWLWPFATFGWPFLTKDEGGGRKEKADLDYFFPTSVLVTAPEIIFFWVARMIMAGYEFTGKTPFRDIYIHGTVRDIEGKKMSKSLGNIIDPLEIIQEYGADALRFSLVSITAQGQDVYLNRERFEQGRNFANKIWNASRFILLNAAAPQQETDLCVFFQKEKLSLANRWILSRFYSNLKEVKRCLDNFRFNEAANTLYSFFWHEFCDWYLELAKPILLENTDQKTQNAQRAPTELIMYKVLEKFLRSLHPFMPFLSEEIWQKIQVVRSPGRKVTSIMRESWPHIQQEIIDKQAEQEMEIFCAVVTAIRNMRAELELSQESKIDVSLFCTNASSRKLLKGFCEAICAIAKVGRLEFKDSFVHRPGTFTRVLKDMHIVIPLSGVIDLKKYVLSLEKKIAKLESEIKAKRHLLKNAGFNAKAPAQVIEAEKAKLKDSLQALEKLKGVLNELRA